MTRRSNDLRCTFCGNEEDLRAHQNGSVYCASCWTRCECPHIDAYTENGVCGLCLRQRHSIITFEGWRLADVVAYAIAAYVDHGIDPGDLRVWLYEEREVIANIRTNRTFLAAIDAATAPHQR